MRFSMPVEDNVYWELGFEDFFDEQHIRARILSEVLKPQLC